MFTQRYHQSGIIIAAVSRRKHRRAALGFSLSDPGFFRSFPALLRRIGFFGKSHPPGETRSRHDAEAPPRRFPSASALLSRNKCPYLWAFPVAPAICEPEIERRFERLKPLFSTAGRNVGRPARDEANQSQLKPDYRYGQRQQQSQKRSQKAKEGKTQTRADPQGFLTPRSASVWPMEFSNRRTQRSPMWNADAILAHRP